LLFPAEEDFGMVPIEAMSAGAPVIAFAKGGARDYVIESRTGMFFPAQTRESLIEGIVKFELSNKFDSNAIADFAKTNFSKDVFRQRFTALVNEILDDYAVKSRRLERQLYAITASPETTDYDGPAIHVQPSTAKSAFKGAKDGH